MITFSVDPSSVPNVRQHFEEYRVRLVTALTQGMRAAMVDLSWAAVEQMQSDGIVTRTGRLLGKILGSVRVSHTETEVKGSISAASKDDPVGRWLEGGTHESAIAKQLMVFFAPNGTLVFTRRHAAFNMPARPFMDQALASSKEKIISTIRGFAAKVAP